jgi:serine O-acetyltransferase
MIQPELLNQLLRQKEQLQIDLSIQRDAHDFTDLLIRALLDKSTELEGSLVELERQFLSLASRVCTDDRHMCKEKWLLITEQLPRLLENMHQDAQAFLNSDPAARSLDEIVMSYPGFYALLVYRLAHQVHEANFPLLPRLMTEYAHWQTGVDIHPAAIIGHSTFIDHATGVVIGETAEIGNNVRIYQGVTLGALFVEKDLRGVKRHPTIEDGVTIYANATILGGKTVIGKNAIIGANTWITSSVPANSKVYHSPEIRMKS